MLTPGSSAAQPTAPPSTQAAEADVFVAHGIVAYDEGRFEDALTMLRRALEIAPDHVDALYNLGLTLLATGLTDEAIESFERVLTLSPDDEPTLFQLGLAHLAHGDYDKAQPPLERAFALNPTRDSLGYYVGVLRYRALDHRGAVEAFRRGVTTNAEMQQLARFYTGLALTALGQKGQEVAAELEEALRMQPASPLTAAAERLRQAALAARDRDRRFRAEVSLGVFYDDNVPAIPLASNDSFIRDLRVKRRDSSGEVGTLRFDYSLLRRAPVETTFTYSFFVSHNNELPQFNIVSHFVGLAGSYQGSVAGMPFFLSLPYSYDYFTLDGDPFLQRHVVAPSLSLIESNSHLTTLVLRYMRKDFFDGSDVDRDDKRDANNSMVGISHLVRFEGDRHFLRFGYQWDVEDAWGRNLSYEGHRIFAGFQYTMPWAALRLNYDFDVHVRDYRHAHSNLPTEAPRSKQRFDSEFTHLVRLALPLPRGFEAVAHYQATRAKSNLELFDYSRNVAFLFLVWRY